MSGTAATADEPTKLLADLRRLQRELIEHRYVRRADGFEGIAEALRQLGEVGSSAGVAARAGQELARGAGFARVVVGTVSDGLLRTLDVWIQGDRPTAEQALAELRGTSTQLRYPLIEADVAQRQQAAIVDVGKSGRRAAPVLTALLGWSAYVVAPVVAEGSTIGMLHADHDGRRMPDQLDLELAGLFAAGLGGAFERVALREKLGRERSQLNSASRWVSAQIRRLDDAGSPSARAPLGHVGELRELLTNRELDVLRLMAGGKTNRAIAEALILGEGTVKSHVRSILGKLHATSRAQAVAHFMRLFGGAEDW